MPSDSPTARLDIDLNALLANYRTLQKRAGSAEVAPVVKADAYGLGCSGVAPHLVRHGAKTFFVARLEEGIALRGILAGGPVIYVLDGLTDPVAFAVHDLRPVLNTPNQYQQWISGPVGIKAALHVDTGMNRLGIRAEEIAALPDRGAHDLTLVMSHLACADEAGHPMNAQQLTAFRAVSALFPGVPASLANSAGHFLGADYTFDLTRPGICLYGGGPFGQATPHIRAVATLSARVLQVRDVRAGETIGYGATFAAKSDMRIATLGVGYADGLMRSFARKGFAHVLHQQQPLTGRISMDLCGLDVTGLDVTINDWAEILGPRQNIDEVAAYSGTIAYELLTRIAARVPRHYLGS
jgi:alanine racemase